MKIHSGEKSNYLLQDIKSGDKILLRVWELLSYYWVSDSVVVGVFHKLECYFKDYFATCDQKNLVNIGCIWKYTVEKYQVRVLFQGLSCHMWSEELGEYWLHIQQCYPLNFTFYEISINASDSSESFSVSEQIHCYHEMLSLLLSGFIVKTCWHISQGEC